MTITDADRLANDATVVELADNRKLKLDFGYGAMRKIEKEFGAAIELVQALIVPAGPRYYEAHAVAVAAGAWQSQIAQEDIEANFPNDVDALNEQLMEALTKALPKLVRDAVKAARTEAEKMDVAAEITKAATEAAEGSTGSGSFTSSPLSVVAANGTSGE